MRRAFATLVLIAFAAYQGLCFVETLRDTEKKPKLLPDNLSWPASWRMFTLLDRRNARIDFEVWDGEAWVRVPMEDWFPMQWESGPRWARSARDRALLQAFLDEACERTGTSRARAVEVRWTRDPTSPLQSESNAEATERATWDCADTPRAPRGRPL